LITLICTVIAKVDFAAPWFSSQRQRVWICRDIYNACDR